uniref:Uncharacterized protein n=1 Tax=Magnetococcus massalia (strain MO-1) TaxID=451514 RepID=A0A1S7LKC8_MAGMO|nr:conserved protein of unknown function [Candidatus Magnetococcus massalia]
MLVPAIDTSKQLYSAYQLNPSISISTSETLSTFGEEMVRYHPLREALRRGGYEGGTLESMMLVRSRAFAQRQSSDPLLDRAITLSTVDRFEIPKTSSAGSHTGISRNLSANTQSATTATYYAQQKRGSGFLVSGFGNNKPLARSVTALYSQTQQLGRGLPSLSAGFSIAA